MSGSEIMVFLRRTVCTLGLVVLYLDFCLVLHPPVLSGLYSKTFNDGRMYYRVLHFDRDNNLYVGAMERLYRLDRRDISDRRSEIYQKSVDIAATEHKKAICASRNQNTKDFDCQNHIRAIVVSAEEVYVCGTGSYSPQQFYLRKSDLAMIKEEAPGSGDPKCPYSPDELSACVHVLKGNPGDVSSVYTGTVRYFQNEPMIFRPELMRGSQLISPFLRSLPSNQDSMWLLDVTFIAAFETADHVYFFFREKPVEFPNMDIHLSRVARVCKNDRGGSSVLIQHWTTFVKAQLNCSLPGSDGQMPFSFDEIRDVRMIDDTFYGVFTTKLSKSSGLFGSAVCSLTVDDVDEAFMGAFKERKADGKWTFVEDSRVPDPRPGSCYQNSQNLEDNVERFIRSHPLMNSPVNQKESEPLFLLQNIVYEKVAIDRVATPKETYTVFFLATDTGEIHKVVQWKDGMSLRNQRVAVWKPFGEASVKIWSMELKDQWLYLGTDEQVTQLAVEQCNKYVMCTDCVRDPYCGWNKNQNVCSKFDPTRASFNETLDRFTQSVEGSALSACTNAGVCYGGNEVIRVRVSGDPVRLDCDSLCDSENGVQWRFRNYPIQLDNRKYVLTQQNGLIIWNVTKHDEGLYNCYRDESLIADYDIQLPGCTDPDCVWHEEFREWCTEFEKYRKEYNHWQCMKNECLENDQHCSPNTIPPNRCPVP